MSLNKGSKSAYQHLKVFEENYIGSICLGCVKSKKEERSLGET